VACAGDEIKPSRPLSTSTRWLQQKLHGIAQKCYELSRRNVLWRFSEWFIGDQAGLAECSCIQFQTEAQLLQHLDLQSLSQVGQVINGKLDEDSDAVNALPRAVSYVGRRNEYLPGRSFKSLLTG